MQNVDAVVLDRKHELTAQLGLKCNCPRCGFSSDLFHQNELSAKRKLKNCRFIEFVITQAVRQALISRSLSTDPDLFSRFIDSDKCNFGGRYSHLLAVHAETLGLYIDMHSDRSIPDS